MAVLDFRPWYGFVCCFRSLKVNKSRPRYAQGAWVSCCVNDLGENVGALVASAGVSCADCVLHSASGSNPFAPSIRTRRICCTGRHGT
jgi:hypothetical protein